MGQSPLPKLRRAFVRGQGFKTGQHGLYTFEERKNMTRVASYNIRKSVGRDYRRNPARVL
jgi:hypothetical protein